MDLPFAVVISRARLGRLAYEHLESAGVPVEPPSSPNIGTFDDTRALGALLATTHTALDTLVLTGDDDPSIWSLTPAMLLGADARWLERGLACSDADREVLVRWREDALALLPPPAEVPRDLCHGEAYPAACRLAASGALAIAELDWVAPGWREYDLATYLWVVAVRPAQDTDARFDDFVAGYASVREPPISGALRAWVAARHLWSLRLAIGFEGRREHGRRADFARTWPIS